MIVYRAFVAEFTRESLMFFALRLLKNVLQNSALDFFAKSCKIIISACGQMALCSSPCGRCWSSRQDPMRSHRPMCCLPLLYQPVMTWDSHWNAALEKASLVQYKISHVKPTQHAVPCHSHLVRGLWSSNLLRAKRFFGKKCVDLVLLLCLKWVFGPKTTFAQQKCWAFLFGVKKNRATDNRGPIRDWIYLAVQVILPP